MEMPMAIESIVRGPLDKVKNFFGIGKFKRMFYVVILFELMERGAYYGMLAVLPYYTLKILHFDIVELGIIMAVLMPCLFLFPLVSGALAEKYGNKTMLFASFTLLLTGYVLSFFMTTFIPLLLTLVVMGLGAGTYKPIVSGSIAQTSGEEHRNHAYSLYYWTINFGATIVPFMIAMFIPKELYGMAFLVSAGLIVVNFINLKLNFHNPVEPNREKKVWEALGNLKIIFQDRRFLAVLMIFCGFWFMYSTIYVLMQPFMLDFGIVGDWFPPALVNVVNPFVIILIGPFIGEKLDRFDSLKLVITGMGICTAGVLMMGLVLHPIAFFGGLAVFTLGEFITYPTFISYASRLAPRDKVPMYMAYVFFPMFLGSALGNLGGTMLYSHFAEGLGMPRFFWAMVASWGLITISCFLLYNSVIAKRDRTEDEQGEFNALPFRQRAASLQTPTLVIVPLLLIPLLAVGSFGLGTSVFYGNIGTDLDVDWDGYSIQTATFSINGECAEQSNSKKTIGLPEENIVNVTVLLRWTDEADREEGVGPIKFTYENGPDKLSFTATLPNGESRIGRESANPHGGEGRTSHKITYVPDKVPYLNGTGDYEINVRCGDCGDFDAGRLPMTIEDTGNAWRVEIMYDFYVKDE